MNILFLLLSKTIWSCWPFSIEKLWLIPLSLFVRFYYHRCCGELMHATLKLDLKIASKLFFLFFRGTKETCARTNAYFRWESITQFSGIRTLCVMNVHEYHGPAKRHQDLLIKSFISFLAQKAAFFGVVTNSAVTAVLCGRPRCLCRESLSFVIMMSTEKRPWRTLCNLSQLWPSHKVTLHATTNRMTSKEIESLGKINLS